MKKTALILLFTFILSLITSLTGFATVIDEKVTVTSLTKGVTHTHIKKFTTSGMYNINYMKIDLNEPTLSLKVLMNDDTRIKSTVLKLAENEENVIGAINADFFTSFSQSAAAEGMTVKDSKLITTPSNDTSYATFTYSHDNEPSIGYFTYMLTVKSERTGEMNQVLFYNKNADPMYLKVYDGNFGAKSPGSKDDGYEVVVEDGIVTKVLSNEEGVEIPKNGYVLHNSLRHSLFLMENFEVGDEVSLELSISPEIEDIKEAVGGGTVLLKDGKKAEFTLKDSLNPITAVGIDKTGKIIYFFTVDGRSAVSRGMTFSEAADFLKDLGCHSAMSFDGGGSTTMVGKLPGLKLQNLNHQSSYRAVINGLGIVAEKQPLGELYGITLSLSQDTVYKGQPLEIYIESAYDEYGNAYDLSEKKIKYSADKKGKFQNNIFYPDEGGEVEITVSIGKIKEKIKALVIENAVAITASKDKFELTNKKQPVSFELKDEDGYSAYIKSDELKVSFENASGTLKNDALILTGLENGSITVSYEDVSLTLPIGEYEVKKVINDKFYKIADTDGYKFGIFGINNYSTTLFSNYVTLKRTDKANLTDLAAFQALPENVTVPTIRVSNYGREDTEHSLFLKLDNSKGGIRETKSEQWEWLLNVFKKGVPQKNVFLTLPLDFEKSNKEEREILTDKLKTNLPDKNIFIISYGDNNTYTVKDGIRYITVTNIPEFSQEKAMEIIDNLKYALFTITENDVYFEFKNILD